MKYIFTILILTGFLFGCSNTATYEYNHWVGRSSSELISNWGIPDETLENQRNGKMLIYYQNGTSKVITGYEKDLPRGDREELIPVTTEYSGKHTVTFYINAEDQIVGYQ